VLAVPGMKAGSIHIELYDLKTTQIINAHTSDLSQIALNRDGTRIATTSEKGTLIRIFDTATGYKLKELRRGADRAEIYSLAFNPESTALCLSSDKGTIHIFGLAQEQLSSNHTNAINRQSTLSFMKDILPSYFSSEWSAAQFHVPEPRSICCFGSSPNSIIVVCADGTCYKYIYDIGICSSCLLSQLTNFFFSLAKGECKQEWFGRFLTTKEGDV
jgi:WD repeat-containing protein 45